MKASRPPPVAAESRGQALLAGLLAHAMPADGAAAAAAALLAEFGDLPALLAAEPARIEAMAGLTEPARALLASVQAAAEEFAAARTRSRPLLNSVERILTYLATASGAEEAGRLRVLFLDAGNRLVADERLAAEDGEAAAMFPGQVVRRALQLHAAAMVLAHSHAAGDGMPAEEDILQTHSIHELAQSVGITLHDHVVIGGDAALSMRQLGLMPGLVRLN